MNKDSTLYWSHIKMYEECPQKFLWTKGWDGIDLGNGSGKPKTKSDKISRHHAVMGIAIHHAIEKLYNDEIWRTPKKVTENLVKIAEEKFLELFDSSYIDLEEAQMTKEDMLKVVVEGAKGFVQTFKHQKLLGEYSRAEVKMLAWIDNWNPIGGYIDILIRRTGVITVLDSKNSKVKMGFCDPRQLHFYALLFKLSYRKLPDRLGFVWLRYPYSEEKEEEGITWLNFTAQEIEEISKTALETKKKMYKKKFVATPSNSSCKFCEFQSVCPERKEDLKLEPKIEKSGSGFSDFSI